MMATYQKSIGANMKGLALAKCGTIWDSKEVTDNNPLTGKSWIHTGINKLKIWLAGYIHSFN